MNPLHAKTVQISQADNFAQLTGGTLTNNLDADFTGDGIADGEGLAASKVSGDDLRFEVSLSVDNFNQIRIGSHFIGVGGGQILSFFISKPPTQFDDGNPQVKTFLLPIKFADSRINQGAETNAHLEVRASHQSANQFTVEIIRLVFDDASTARPAGVTPGGTNPAWTEATPPTPIATSNQATKRKIKKLKRQLKRAKKKKNRKKIKKIKRKIRALRRRL